MMTGPPDIYALAVHDALPIYRHADEQADEDVGAEDEEAQRVVVTALGLQQLVDRGADVGAEERARGQHRGRDREDRKSTRLNSSHANISYDVFCLKKKRTHPI